MPRLVGAYGVDRVIHKKITHSQLMGRICLGHQDGAVGKTEMDWCVRHAVKAIMDAIYHATGERIRDLPITPDKVVV